MTPEHLDFGSLASELGRGYLQGVETGVGRIFELRDDGEAIGCDLCVALTDAHRACAQDSELRH